MIPFLEKVKEKIGKKLDLQEVTVIDNSSLHSKHKSYSPDKFWLKLIIKSEKLKSMKKIEAHRKIYSILQDEIKKIHALEIEIK